MQWICTTIANFHSKQKKKEEEEEEEQEQEEEEEEEEEKKNQRISVSKCGLATWAVLLDREMLE